MHQHKHVHVAECNHDMAFCKECRVPYCQKCGKEWFDAPTVLPFTYPWPGTSAPYYPWWGTTTNNTNGTITVQNHSGLHYQ